MRTLLTILVIFLFFNSNITAQIFTEDFEAVVGMTSNPTNGWGVNTRLHSQGLKSDSGRIIQNAENILTTTSSFSTLGLYAVYLDFDQICKLQFGDSAIIEVSNDNGVTWQRVVQSNYLGTAVFGYIGDAFNETSYGTFWDPTGPTMPTQAWWKSESFDISNLAENSANVKIRFKVVDGNGNGAVGRAGWFLDNIIVNASISEMIPPSVALVSPFPIDTVYSDNPVTVKASISDLSGINSAYCIVSSMPFGQQDTILMTYDPNTVDTFSCQIPFYGFGRTTSYYVKAYDGSFIHNVDSTATISYMTKYSSGGIAEIGTGTSSSSYPFYTYYHDARSQFIYTAAEISANGTSAGPITSIAFNVSSIGGQAMNSFSVKMKNSSLNSLTGFESGFTTVYTNSAYNVATTGWQTINLASPFLWDGVSNLIIEVCFDNTSYSSNSLVYATAAAGKTWGNMMDNGTGCSLTGGSLQSNRPNIQLNITGSSQLTNDLGVMNILNPTTGVIAGQDFEVKVDLKNYGVDTIRNAQISWTYDGVNQTPYILSAIDSILPDGIMSPIILDTLTSTIGGHTIIAWSEMPNGVVDINIINDSAEYSFYGCASSLSGAYTIGGAGADFSDFAEAILALDQCGISSAVTFNVNDGVYTEQILIENILGISSTNTVSFQSVSGDSSTVIIKHLATDTNNNYVVKVDGISNITFSNMTFEAMDSTYSRVFDFINDINNITINNNIIKNTISADTTDDNKSLIIGNMGNNINISNNSMINGSNAINLYADTQGLNWDISGNEINGVFTAAISLKYAESATISSNIINANILENASLFFGINLQNNTGNVEITNNEIYSTVSEMAKGINLDQCSFDIANPANISNNFIQIHVNTQLPDNSSGIEIYNTSNVNAYFNTVNIIGNQPVSSPINLTATSANSTQNINIVNNIFANNANGYIYSINNVDTNQWTNHHNDLWNNNAPQFAFLDNDIVDFAEWQTKTSEANSININPYFVSSTDIHIVNNAMNGTAIAIGGITTDIDGDIRNASTPDIGADEFDPSPWDASIVNIADMGEGCGLSDETIKITIKNLGNVDINGNLTASYRLSPTSTIVTETISNPIATGDTLIYSFATLADLDVYASGQDSVFNVSAWVNLQSDPVTNNDSAHIDINSKYAPLSPIVSDTLISYGDSVSITATSPDSLIWYETNAAINELSTERWYNTGILYDTTAYWVGATSGNANIKLTETVQYKTASGATNPYPAYLPTSDFDGIEISNLGNSNGDLSGYTININVSSTTVSYTFPANTNIAMGSVVLVVYGSGLPSGPAGNNMYYAPYINISSSTLVSYWLTDNTGNVVDAFASNGALFPSTSPVTISDFSGDLLGGVSHPGAIRTISDNNTAADWQVISPTVASFGTINADLVMGYQPNSGCHSILVPLTVNINNIPQNDLSIIQLQSPNSGYYLNSNTNVQVEVANYGAIAKDTIPLAYQLNTQAIVYDTLFQTLNSGETAIFTFGQTINLSQFGSYDFKVYTHLSYDTDNNNDSVVTVITNDSLIYCDSYATSAGDSRIDEVILEGINNNTTADGCSTYSNFSTMSTVLAQGIDYQISVTIGTCGSNYLKGAKAWIDFNNDGDFEDSGEEIGNFGSASSTFTATSTFTVPANASAGIHKMRVVGREGAGTNNASVGACGTYSYGETEDYTIIIVPLIQYDAGVQEVYNIADTSNEGASITPIVVVKNYGFDTLTSFDILYSVNGGAAVVYNYNDTLLSFQRDTITLASFNSPAGISTLCTYSSLSSDLNTINDSACITYYGKPTKDAELLRLQHINEYCGMNYDTIIVQLTNIGVDTINAVGQTNPTTISYQSNSLSPITETFTQMVAPGDTVWYQFSSLVYVGSNNTMDSLYNIKAWINFIGDNVAYNDSASTFVESLHIPSPPTVVNPVIIPFASPATLIANNAPGDSILWYEDSQSTNIIFGGSPYTTPWLNFHDTVFWAVSSSGAPTATSTIGTGTISNSSTSYPSPYANFYWGNKEQYLIHASELIAQGASAGPISELAFDVSTPNACPNLQNFELKLGNSSQTILSTYETGLTTVYSNTSGYQPTSGWNNHVFSTPFIWDGTSNVIVQVCSQNTGYIGSGNASVNGTATSFTSVKYYYADNTGVCGSTSGTSSSIRPNMKLLISGNACQSTRTPVNITVLPLSACDVGASDLVGPISSIYMGTNETIIAEVQNYGNVDQTNIPISYQINGGAIITESVSVAASSSTVYSFNTKADFSNIGSQYNVKLSTGLMCDTTSLNNNYEEFVANISPSYCVSSADYNTYHDIENVTIGGINNTSPSPFNKLYTDYTNINPGTLSPGSNFSFSIKINSASTTPSGGFIKIYIDYNRDGVFDASTEQAAALPYNNASSNYAAMAYGSVSVPSNVALGLTRMRVVAVRNGTASSVEPCGTYSYGETEDYPVYLANTISHDASISKITTPNSLTTASAVPVTVRVHNYGTDLITSVDISYSVNNNPPTIITFNSTSINQGNYVDVPLGNISISDGMNNICAKTILAGDSNTFNDNRCTNVFKEAIVNLSYSDDFEGANLWMDDTISNQWERGFPSMTSINYAHSPSNVWATNLSGNYSGTSMQYLYSPKFIITSNIDTAYLKFWHYYITENSNDGAFIQYQKNGGTWVTLGYATDLRATNWYNSTTGGTHKWTGNSGGWIQSTFDFDFLNGEFQNTTTLQLRYVFFANASSNNYDGWAIDDFELTIPAQPIDVGITNITNLSNVQIGDITNVSVAVHNYGTTAQGSFPVWYKLDNGAVITETFTPSSGSLTPNATESFTFSQTSIQIASSSFNLCSGTNLSNDAYPQNDDYCKTFIASTANIDAGIIEVFKQQIWGGEDTTSIYSPVNIYGVIKNFGLSDLTSFNIDYSIDNGSTWTTETWTGNLAFGETDTFHFANTYSSPLGNYIACVRTLAINDANVNNNELCQPFVGVSINNTDDLEFVLSQNRPNPAHGIIKISYIIPHNGNIEFNLRNTLGQVIYTKQHSSFTGSNTIEINTKDLANGVYYYTVIFDNQRLTRKMIISK